MPADPCAIRAFRISQFANGVRSHHTHALKHYKEIVYVCVSLRGPLSLSAKCEIREKRAVVA